MILSTNGYKWLKHICLQHQLHCSSFYTLQVKSRSFESQIILRSGPIFHTKEITILAVIHVDT